MPEPLRPQPLPTDFQTAAVEVLVPVPLAFRDEDTFRDEVEVLEDPEELNIE